MNEKLSLNIMTLIKKDGVNMLNNKANINYLMVISKLYRGGPYLAKTHP